MYFAKFILTLRITGALFMQDMPPQLPEDEVYACRTNISSPAGFDYLRVDQVKAGDIVVAYEDMCPEAIARFGRGEGTLKQLDVLGG